MGLSEVSAEQVRAAHAITPITAVELEWSLFTRDVEVGAVLACTVYKYGMYVRSAPITCLSSLAQALKLVTTVA